MAQKSIKLKKRSKICKLSSCGVRFFPARSNQVFCSSDHRKEHWEQIQDTQATDDYREFLQYRAEFRRYMKNRSRINAWLKANKK